MYFKYGYSERWNNVQNYLKFKPLLVLKLEAKYNDTLLRTWKCKQNFHHLHYCVLIAQPLRGQAISTIYSSAHLHPWHSDSDQANQTKKSSFLSSFSSVVPHPLLSTTFPLSLCCLMALLSPTTRPDFVSHTGSKQLWTPEQASTAAFPSFSLSWSHQRSQGRVTFLPSALSHCCIHGYQIITLKSFLNGY